MDEILITMSGKSDIDGIIELWKEGTIFHRELEPDYFRFDENYIAKYREILQNTFENKDAQVFVARLNGSIIGCIIGFVKYPQSIFKQDLLGYIDLVYVKKDFRNKGIAKILLEKLEEWFETRDIKYIELNCYIRNDVGLDFWNRNDYLPISVKLRKNKEKDSFF